MLKLSGLSAGMLRTVAGGCERLPTPSEHDSNLETPRTKRNRFATHSVFFPPFQLRIIEPLQIPSGSEGQLRPVLTLKSGGAAPDIAEQG